MNKVLVTGGAGYIGSVVVAQLLAAGYEVVVYDNLSHGFAQAVKGARLVTGDLADQAKLSELFKQESFDAVMNFAALIEAGESMKVPERYFHNNSFNTLCLLEVMLQHKVNKLVFSSTAALYGEPQRVPIAEDDLLLPTNAYGASKLLVEQMLSWFAKLHGLRYASLRYFNAAGATLTLGESHRPESHLIPLLLQVALGKRENISVFGTDYPTPDGTCVRDYIHVEDLASAHLLALNALLEESGSMIFNLGNGRGFSVKEVLETARRVTGHAIPAVMQSRRPGDPAVLVASSEKIRQTLGWSPRKPDLETIVSDAWRWLQAHPDGY